MSTADEGFLVDVIAAQPACSCASL